jgi:molecular chaperone Hsp33
MEQSDSSEVGAMSFPGRVVVSNRFVRGRNVLLSEVDSAPLVQAMRDHAQMHGVEVPAHLDLLMRELLVVFTLHAASRPRNELLAWTIRFPHPVVSCFLGADTEMGTVVGRFFEHGVKDEPMGEMHQELHRRGKEPHRSMVAFAGWGAKAALEVFYEESEQRPARFFDLGGGRYALVSAHPDYDEGWFTHVDAELIARIDQREVVNLLETRAYYWHCGCSRARIRELLTPIMKRDPRELFGEDASVQVHCPRCAAVYAVTRAELESPEGGSSGAV